jgi:hypothetical protein
MATMLRDAIDSRAAPQQGEVEQALADVLAQHPKLGKTKYNIIDSRGQAKPDNGPSGGQIEFYPADEEYNPRPGNPTLEVFNPDLKGQALKSAIFGDLLHNAKNVIPGWEPLRQMFMRSITPEQMAIDKRAYQEAQKDYGEKRSFSDWFQQSRLDAYIRGALAPDQADQWRDAYTPQQRQILGHMLQTLQ